MIKTNRIIVTGLVSALVFLSFLSCSTSKEIPDKKDELLAEKQEMEYTHYFIEGNKLKTLGYFPEAIAAFTKCIDLKKDAAAPNYELANLNIYVNNYSKALEYAEKAATLVKENIWYQLLYANLLAQHRQYDKAASIFEKLRKSHPGDIEISMSLADLYTVKEKDYDKALKLYDEIEYSTGISEEIYFKKEKLYIAMGKEDKLLKELEKLVNAFPDNPRYIGIYAETLMNFGKRDEALAAYQKLFEIDPENPIGHLSYGEFLFKLGNKQEAIAEFKMGIDNKNLDIKPKLDLIISLMKYYGEEFPVEMFYILLDHLNQAHPDKVEGHGIKAELYIRDNRLKEAQEELLLVLKLEKDNFKVWEQLILIDSELGEYEKMYVHSHEAIEYFPNYPKFLLYHSFACQRLKKFQEGIEALEIGIDLVIDQDDLKAQFYASLGELYYRTNQYLDSDKAFDKALEINSEDKIVLNNYSYYLALRSEKLDRAKEMAKKVVDLEPKNSTYLDTYAWVLYKIGEVGQAKIFVKQAIENDSNPSAVVIEHYGDILYKTGNKEQALEEWIRAKEKGQGSEFLDVKIERGELVE